MFASNFHSRMSPSCSERTVNCPGWVLLAPEAPEEDNRWHEMSLAHHLGATCLTSEASAHYYIKHKLPPDEEGKFAEKVTKVMADHIQLYVDYVVNLRNQTLEALDGDKTLLEYHTELRVGALHLHKEAHGTGDNFTGRHFGPLHVVDLKYGTAPVSPKKSYQLRSYGLYFIETFGSFDPIFLHIYQPRSGQKSPVKVWKTSTRELRHFQKVLIPAMKRAEKPNAPLKEGKWCWFCPSKFVCPLIDEKKQEEVYEYFDEEDAF